MASLPNLADLEAEWAEFMFNRPGDRPDWSQDQKWRADNPGKTAALLTYRQGGARPSFSTSKPGSPERRMLRHLDAYIKAKGAVEPPPPPPPQFNPQTYNKGSSGQDARYCVTFDDGCRYDSGGREIDGRRSGQFVPGLKPADEMDGREPCDPYTNGEQSFPPWPAKSYER